MTVYIRTVSKYGFPLLQRCIVIMLEMKENSSRVLRLALLAAGPLQAPSDSKGVRGFAELTNNVRVVESPVRISESRKWLFAVGLKNIRLRDIASGTRD